MALRTRSKINEILSKVNSRKKQRAVFEKILSSIDLEEEEKQNMVASIMEHTLEIDTLEKEVDSIVREIQRMGNEQEVDVDEEVQQ